MSDWQPIETAPKDGTPILGYFPSRYGAMFCVRWVLWGDGVWQCVSTGMNVMAHTPSHWMPLPPAPESKDE